MSNFNNLDDAIAAAGLEIQQQITGFAAKVLQRKTLKVEKAVRNEMQLLVRRILGIVKTGGVGIGGSPSNAEVSSTWKNLSEQWIDKKRYGGGQPDYYSGLTEAMARKAKGKRGQGNRRRAKSFIRYLQGLNSSGFGSKALGDPTFQFYLGDTPVKFVEGKTKRVTLRDMQGKFQPTPKAQDTPSMVVTVFPKLQVGSRGVLGSERNIISQMWNSFDNEDQKQWYKVGSDKAFGGKRPIRPVLGPLLRWYLKVGFKRAIQGAVK